MNLRATRGYWRQLATCAQRPKILTSKVAHTKQQSTKPSRLFAKLSSDYRGDPNETKRFRIDWGMDSRTLNESLKKHDKHRKEERQKNSSGLQFTEKGTLFPNLQNACQLMLADPEMRNVFKFNQMTLDIDVMQPVPGEASRGGYPHKLGDVDISDAMLWLQKHEMFMVTETTTRSAVQNIAFNNQYHPVCDYLASLQWDGTPRIDTWLIDYGGAKDNLYVREISAMFLIQMVARVMEPGCKADYILFLVGPQGIFKSTVARKLGKQWFSDDLPDIRDKRKTSLHLCGLWVAELSELSSMSRAEVEDWKAFAARRVDKYQKTIRPLRNDTTASERVHRHNERQRAAQGQNRQPQGLDRRSQEIRR